MATLTTTLTLTSTDASIDQLSFSVSDNLSITHPQVGLSKVAATTTVVTLLYYQTLIRKGIYI